jgi:hypothetical protein
MTRSRFEREALLRCLLLLLLALHLVRSAISCACFARVLLFGLHTQDAGHRQTRAA